ncbi:MAG: DUF4831 family protein [Paludibacteraceae bacterium]|nr:DUF4831 family protein [Paludibacteraceae bacterium]MBR1481139.1 DUF4831 family protein [Paludibacteraceae bacterium]
MTIKHIVPLMIGAACSLIAPATYAQTISDNETALVYYMPQTELVFYIDYIEETCQAGPFFLFAEQYFGTTDVVQEDSHRYRLTAIRTGTHSLPDPERAYKVEPRAGISTQLLSLTDQGILRGYNIGAAAAPRKATSKAETDRQDEPEKPMIIPMTEEQVNAKTLEQMAAATMKQLFHLREMRLYLLNGEVENAPADGQAMELVLNELNRQEQQLTELFLGRRTYKHCTRRITYLPTHSEQAVIARFSTEKGITSASDSVGAEPIVLTINTQKQVYTAPVTPQKGKKAPAASQIYYNLPGSAHYVVTWQDRTMAERRLQLPQLGIAIPLTEDLFSEKSKAPRIHINPKTGNIQSITQ